MRIWTIKIGKKEFKVKSLKREAESFQNVVDNMVKTPYFSKEITGIVGNKDSERTTLLFTLFTPNKLDNPEQFEQERDAFLENMPELIEKKDLPELIKKANEIRYKHIPIVDERKTVEVIEERNNKYKKEQKKREEKTQVFIAEYCKPEPVKIPDGMMAVYLQITFDDSDVMTDYFNRHSRIGKEMLLAIVPNKRKTEKLARSVLSNYSKLSKYKWTWHVENYSMGHGNYLISEWTDNKFEKNAYDRRTEVSTRYEIKFNEYSEEMYLYKDYIENGSDNSVEVADENVEGVIVRKNEVKNGVEIKFPDKPSQEIRDRLKIKGFRYSRKLKIWYSKFTADKLIFAESFTKSA